MSLKTILVHIDNEAQARPLLQAAVRLAEQHTAHLIGIYAAHAMQPYLARANELALSDEITKALIREAAGKADTISKIFESATSGKSFVSEWRFDSNVGNGVVNTILHESLSVDALIVGTDNTNSSSNLISNQVGPIIMNSSRPTIVIPETYEDKTIGDYVLVAWDGSRESSRAIFDALPILKHSKNVWIHRVKSKDDTKHHEENVTRDIADSLARHGVSVELSESVKSARHVGEELLTIAKSRGADSIVMGAYGHTRVHDLLLGGATRHILANTNIPLIMSR